MTQYDLLIMGLCEQKTNTINKNNRKTECNDHKNANFTCFAYKETGLLLELSLQLTSQLNNFAFEKKHNLLQLS